MPASFSVRAYFTLWKQSLQEIWHTFWAKAKRCDDFDVCHAGRKGEKNAWTGVLCGFAALREIN
jgi:hypothetical protein